MSTDGKYRAFEVLLVEDNPADARLMVETFKDAGVQHNLNVVNDGVEAIAFLRRKDKYKHAPRPDLILLDLNLPKKNGKEVLAEIKNDPNLKLVPVVILTISSAEQDIITCYNLHANCYIIKPIELDRFIEIIKSIVNFWFTVVKLPPGD